MAEDLGLSPVWVFGAFSMAMVVSAMVGPWAGARIDGFGGRGVLMLSNLVFAAGLGLLAVAPSPLVLFAGWAVVGLGMGIGLYEAGFATLAGIYGKDARGTITGITLIAGFASTVGWPLSGLMLATWGWREACLAEHLETTEKVNDVQRRMLEAAARRPRDHHELAERLRDGRF
jgi:MFS family permease